MSASVRLIDVFAPALDVGSRLLAANSLEGLSFESAAAEFESALVDCQKLAAEGGKPAADIESSSAALIYWFDEVLAGTGLATQSAQSLQARKLGTTNGGEDFYRRAAALGKERPEVREVYHTLLGLGFQGQFALEDDPQARITEVRRQLAADMPAPPINLAASPAPKLTPEPYTLKDPEPAPAAPASGSAWIKYAVAAAIVLPGLAAIWPLLRTERASAPGPAPVASHQGLACDQRNQSLPFCDFEREVERIARESKDSRPTVRFLGGSDPKGGSFAKGDPLRLEVLQKDFEAYFEVIYLDANSNATRLPWKPRRGPAAVGVPVDTFQAGAGEPWHVTPPFGDEALLVIASAKPLQWDGEPQGQDARQLLTKLQSLSGRGTGNDRLTATMVRIRTKAGAGG